MALPIERSVLSTDILDLVRNTSLNLLTSKYVRTHMEKKHNVKLSDFRKEIDAIIRDSIEKIETDTPPKATNGTASNNNSTKIKSKVESESPVSAKSSSSSVPKREPSPKADTPISLADFAFDEDNDKFSAIKRRRATQRPAVQRKPAAKRAKKTKESGGSKKNTAFTRICVLSDELSGILNKKYMRRSDVVKLMWEYFREKNLMDPKDKRFVIFDEPMRAVFGVRRIQAFGMMKVLKNHIKDLEFLDEDTRRTAMHEIEQLEELGELDRGNVSSTANTSKFAAEESVSSDSSSDSEPEPKPSTPPPPKPANNNHAVSASPSTSKTEEPRAAKLVLRISKKNDRVVSVKVNEEEETQQNKNARLQNDNGSAQNASSNASTIDMEGPPQLDLEVTNDPASSSQDSSSGSSSSGSSGSSSSSSASSSPERPTQNNVGRRNATNDLQLSESDSD